MEKELHPQTLDAMCRYHWPGNVRELSNVLERVLFSVDGDLIDPGDLPVYVRHTKRSAVGPKRVRLKEIRDRTDEETIRYALERSGYNKVKTAELLGIHRSVLYRKIKRYGISLNTKGDS